MKILSASAWFDGEHYHDTPVSLVIDRARIVDVVAGVLDGVDVQHCAFVMPALVEAHCHLFLDGGELDFGKRSRYLEAAFDVMCETARRNVARTLEHGITLVRDAGDRFGVNHAMRAESTTLRVRSAGIALRRPKRYGSFMAREVDSLDEARAAIREIADSADDLKIIQTGIIDFESGSVKGGPQFNLEALTDIVRCARAAGLRTFAHCSGTEGIDVAVQAGVDSIEHGFFMTPAILRRMAAQGTAWVPTFSPVDFQWRRPELAGWSAATVANLRGILDAHTEQVALAAQLGVNLVAGSDAGSPGVEHGAGLVAELFHFLDCGMTMAQTLHAATSRPRRLWGAEATDICRGHPVNLALFDADPFLDRANLLRVVGLEQ